MSSNTPDLAPPPRSMHLPTELLSQIILDPALSTSDLVHLCQTSRQLLHPARKALYRHLHVRMGYAKFDSIPSYRLRGVGRMCSDKRTLSLIGTLRKSPEIGNLARTIEIGNPMSPLHDLADFQCNDHREGVNELLNLVPNVMAVKHLSSHGSCLVNDAFLNRTPPILELEVASHWSHDVIKQESSLVNLRKLRIDSFLHPPAPEYSISTAPPFQNLRILDIGNWATGVPIIELPAQLVPNLHVLRTSYASLRSIDISTFPRLRTLHLCNDWSKNDVPLLENAHRISASTSLVTISFNLSMYYPLLHNSIEPILNRPPPLLRIFEFPEVSPHHRLLQTRLNNVVFRVRQVKRPMEMLDRRLLETAAEEYNFRVVVFTETVDVFGKFDLSSLISSCAD